jgi:hypothetical protein
VTIVGFPFSGKSALFTAISGVPKDHLRPAEENLAAVKIHEPRLEYLEKLYSPKKRTEPTIDFIDLPGSAEGDDEKAGLEKHLPTLRMSDALVLIVRGFESASVPMHGGRIDPQADLQKLREEMLFADLLTCSTRLEKLEKAAAKPSKDRDHQLREVAVLERCRDALEYSKPLSKVIQPGEEEKLVRSFGFLTQKPDVVVVNVGERDIGKPPSLRDGHAIDTLAVCASLEADLMQMDAADRPGFMREYGIQALAHARIVRACFDALAMICFLTAGPEEVRAWAVPRGTTAVEAAARVHTDLARGFIKAETVAFDDLYKAGSMRDAKAAGRVRQEPKTYVVQDGDVILIKHSA